jgi:hypothetical protein
MLKLDFLADLITAKDKEYKKHEIYLEKTLLSSDSQKK